MSETCDGKKEDIQGETACPAFTEGEGGVEGRRGREGSEKRV